MTVVIRYGNAVKAPTALNPAAAIDAEGQVRSAYSNIPVNQDSATSTHILARMPSSARLLPGSSLFNTALAGLTSYDVGFGINGVVIPGKQNLLMSAQSMAVAGNITLLTPSLGAGNIGRKLWDLAGYTTDPGGMIDVIGTVNASATGTGNIETFVQFAKQ